MIEDTRLSKWDSNSGLLLDKPYEGSHMKGVTSLDYYLVYSTHSLIKTKRGVLAEKRFFPLLFHPWILWTVYWWWPAFSSMMVIIFRLIIFSPIMLWGSPQVIWWLRFLWSAYILSSLGVTFFLYLYATITKSLITFQ